MIVLIGGQKSGSGKTTFICSLLKAFPSKFSVLKVTPSDEMQNKIETDLDVLFKKGKDTARFLEYSSKKVIWVRGKRESVSLLVNKALSLLDGDILIEGNSAISYVNFDVAFFISRFKEKIGKESARIFKQRADFIIMNTSQITPAYIASNVIYANLESELRDPSENFIEILSTTLHCT